MGEKERRKRPYRVSPLRRRDLRSREETAAPAEGMDLGIGSWAWCFEEMDRGKGWNLKSEGVRKRGFGFGSREGGGVVAVAVAAATTVVAVVMLPIFVLVLESTLVILSPSTSDFSDIVAIIFDRRRMTSKYSFLPKKF